MHRAAGGVGMTFNVGFLTEYHGAFVSQVHAPNSLHAEICAVRLARLHQHTIWIEDEETGNVYLPDEKLVAEYEARRARKEMV